LLSTVQEHRGFEQDTSNSLAQNENKCINIRSHEHTTIIYVVQVSRLMCDSGRRTGRQAGNTSKFNVFMFTKYFNIVQKISISPLTIDHVLKPHDTSFVKVLLCIKR